MQQLYPLLKKYGMLEDSPCTCNDSVSNFHFAIQNRFAVSAISFQVLLGKFQFVFNQSSWWFGTFFPYIGNSNPNRLIFFRGVETTNQCICLLVRFLWCDLFDHQKTRPRKAFDCDSDFPHRATSVGRQRQLINVGRKGC